MYSEKIEKLENEILELKKYIQKDKKEIKKREKILLIREVMYHGKNNGKT